jgi:hypothetical protein
MPRVDQEKMDKQVTIAREEHLSKFQENQILYMDGKITWEEFEKHLDLFEEETKMLEKIDFELKELEYSFENGLISERDFNIKKERLKNRIIRICE